MNNATSLTVALCCLCLSIRQLLVTTGAGQNQYSVTESLQFEIPVEFDLSGHLQSRCQKYVPVGNKASAICCTIKFIEFTDIIYLIITSHSVSSGTLNLTQPNPTSHSNLEELLPF